MNTTLSKLTVGLALAALASPAWAQDNSPAPAADAPSAGRSGAEPGLRFNFRGAPLETVLNYMSEAAGFVVVLQTPVTGTVDMWSAQPVSRAEAVQLLGIALNKNGYGLSVEGRTLVVSAKDDAKNQNIPIHTGNDPADIPMTAQVVMQIIPLRHIDATQAAKDLATMIPSSSTLTANQDSNSLIVTDTETNIHHIVEIVSQLDGSIDTISTTQVFHLKNADPVEMATLIMNLYGTPSPTAVNGGGQNRGGGLLAALGGGGFGGGGFGGAAGGGGGRGGNGGFGGGGNGGGGRGGNGGTGRSGGRTVPVVAVADPRTYSVVVTAAKEQLPDIAEMINRLDSDSGRKQQAYTINMQNADVQQVQQILQNLFQSSTSRSSASTQADPLNNRATTNAQSANTAPALNLGSSSTTGR